VVMLSQGASIESPTIDGVQKGPHDLVKEQKDKPDPARFTGTTTADDLASARVIAQSVSG